MRRPPASDRSVIDLFDRIDLFSDCTRRERRLLQRTGTPLRRPARSVLAVQGDVADQVVLILDGTATAIDDAGAHVLGAGDLVGATEVGRRRPHPRTVLVTADTEVVVYDPGEFATLMREIPGMSARLAEIDARTALAATLDPARVRRRRVADIVMAISR